MRPDEALLESREIGSIDYTLDYYGDEEPYYWRYREEAEQASGGNVKGGNPIVALGHE